MKQSEADRLAVNLVVKFGLPVKAVVNAGAEGQHILLIPEGVHPNDGYMVDIQVGWRNLYMQFIPGKFAADLVRQMGKCGPEGRKIFSSVAGHILQERGALNFKVNGMSLDPRQPAAWPEEWKTIEFTLRRSPLEINTEDHGLTERLINSWVERFFGCIMALSPLEEADEAREAPGLPEGAVKRELVNRYERSRYNRAVCINFHGCRCKVCGFDFEVRYGRIGAGFIHVHHIVPVSRLGPGYLIDPVEDLVPVCANCHSMLHRRDPPYTVEELKRIMKTNPGSDPGQIV